MEEESLLDTYFTPFAQFQLITVCVWITELILVVVLIRHSGQWNSRWGLCVLHLLPWAVGFQERRKLLRSSVRNSDQFDPTHSLTRILWASYVAIIGVEFILF
jgi:hypothetical protein